nr:cullin-1-like isoform X1 [Ipomoea batatas]
MIRMTLEDGMNRLEEGVAKAMMMMDGYTASALFSSEEYMKYYEYPFLLAVVFIFCVFNRRQMTTHGSFMKDLRKFCKKVLPSLSDKNGAPLLSELLRLWANYKSMVKCLGGFYLYLDQRFSDRESAASLSEISVCCFHDMVCNAFLQKFIDAAILLITQDRNGQPTDQTFLQSLSNFFNEVGGKTRPFCYNKFEEAILVDTGNYYSQVAPEWLLNYSSAEYAFKAEQCLREERGRASKILHRPGVEKLLQIVHWKLVGEITNQLIEKQNAENLDASRYKRRAPGWEWLAAPRPALKASPRALNLCLDHGFSIPGSLAQVVFLGHLGHFLEPQVYIKELLEEIVNGWLESKNGIEKHVAENVVAYDSGCFDMQRKIYEAFRCRESTFSPSNWEFPGEIEDLEKDGAPALDKGSNTVEGGSMQNDSDGNDLRLGLLGGVGTRFFGLQSVAYIALGHDPRPGRPCEGSKPTSWVSKFVCGDDNVIGVSTPVTGEDLSHGRENAYDHAGKAPTSMFRLILCNFFSGWFKMTFCSLPMYSTTP